MSQLEVTQESLARMQAFDAKSLAREGGFRKKL